MSEKRPTTTRRRPQAPAPELPPVSRAPVPAPVASPPPPAPPRAAPAVQQEAQAAPIAASDLAELANLGAAEFAQLLAGSLDIQRQRLRPGDAVRGRVVRVGDRHVFIDLGGKSEGAMDRQELSGPDGALLVALGEEVDGVVVSLHDGLPQLARRLSGGAARERLELAQQAGLPVEGKVVERNSGGYVVELGGARGFCPISQMDLPGAAEPADGADPHLGRTYSFRVQDLRGRDVVLGRRAILEEQRQKLAEATRARLSVGQQVEVTVRSLRPHGAIVELEGVEGFIPRRELGWEDDAELDQAFQPGQRLRARVRGLDGGRVTLSARDAAPTAPGQPSRGGLGTLGDLLAAAKRK